MSKEIKLTLILLITVLLACLTATVISHRWLQKELEKCKQLNKQYEEHDKLNK